MQRLHPSVLNELHAGVQLPPAAGQAIRPGSVHLGLGAFHRAHQAVYTEDAMALAGGDWGIIGVSLRSDAVARQLRPQQCLYSVLAEDDCAGNLRVVAAIVEVLVAPEDPGAVAAAIARQDIHLVTLTITEKGYILAGDGRSLDLDDALIRSDLANSARPASAIGLLALGLQQRMAAGGAPLSILSCDNLAHNSRVLHGVLVDYLARAFPAVLPWLEQSVSFPCSVVDRIVPAMTAAQRQRQGELLGASDAAAARTETFSQWIIEDNFKAPRPQWERAGAQLVADVTPYAGMKLRLLNASHSAIAYCGLLAGLETVDAVLADAQLGAVIEALLLEELAPALAAPDGFDVQDYCRELLARFRNPHLHHHCAQIAMDGSEKIPQRWLPTLQHVAAPRLRLALAAWCYFILCTQLDIDDPRSTLLQEQRHSARPLPERLAAVLDCAGITMQSLPGREQLLQHLEQDLEVIGASGIRNCPAQSEPAQHA